MSSNWQRPCHWFPKVSASMGGMMRMSRELSGLFGQTGKNNGLLGGDNHKIRLSFPRRCAYNRREVLILRLHKSMSHKDIS